MVYATPESIDAVLKGQEEAAQIAMQKVGEQLSGLPCEAVVEHGAGVWPSVERAIDRYRIDLIVLGTRGRTGASKLLLGSVAEEIFRRARVPVVTIGPWAHKDIKGAKLHSVLFATDFTAESLAAAPYAVSMAEENQARLTLLHVEEEPRKTQKREAQKKVSAEPTEDAIKRLGDLIPKGAEFWCVPETVVRFGNPAEQILETAQAEKADLIVMGVRGAAGHLGAATHLGRPIAHKVAANATCPVLTVRA